MAVISTIRTGIKNVLDDVSGVKAYDFQTDAPQLPAGGAAVVVSWPDTWDPHIDFNAGSELDIALKVLVQFANDQVGDALLETMLDRIVTALEASGADTTIGGALLVRSVTNVGRYELGQGVYALGCEINVRVYV